MRPDAFRPPRLTSTPLRLAGVGALIGSGLVSGYLGNRPGVAYASLLPQCSTLVPGGISTDDSFNLAVAKVNLGLCNVIDISGGFTFHTPPAVITSVLDDSLSIIGLDADDSVLNGDDSQGIALEVAPGLTLAVSTLTLTNFDDTVGSSTSALSVRTSTGPAHVRLHDLVFSHNYSGGSGGAVYVSAGTYAVDVTVDGTSLFSHNTARLSAGAVFTKGAIAMDDTLTIHGATFADNTSLATSAAGGSGGGAVQASIATITDSQFLRNTAFNQGGAISAATVTTDGVLFEDDSAPIGGAIQGADLVIGSGTHFTSNQASGGGGAINVASSLATHDAYFTDNHAGSEGGAVYTSSGTVETHHTVFAGNVAAVGGGGAIRSMTGTVSSQDDSFSGNSANNAGGAIFDWLAPVHASGSHFSSNSAYSGGGIASQSHAGTTSLTGVTFDGNYSHYAGGAIDVLGHALSITGSSFVGNNSHDHGGAISVDDTSALTLSDDTFAANHAIAGKGGGVYSSGHLTIVDSLFADDTAAGRGGAVYTFGTSYQASIDSSTFTGNTSTVSYGGAVSSTGPVRLYDSELSLNAASGRGGAVYSLGAVTLARNTFDSNHAGVRGGAVYANASLDDTASAWSSNTSIDRGGAASSHGAVTLHASDFTGNSSANGGAVYARDQLDAINAVFTDDTASATGGAIFTNGPIYLSYSTLTGNAAGDGGAIFNNDDTTTITNATLANNSATGTGGALRTITGPINLRFASLIGNTAPHGSALGSDSASPIPIRLTGSVLAGNSGSVCDNLRYPYHFPIDATSLSERSFATDDSCTGGVPSTNPLRINTSFTSLSALGFDDTTLFTDDSTGQRVLVPNLGSPLIGAAPASLATGHGVTVDQLLASRSLDDSTTVGAVQVLPFAFATQPQSVTTSPGGSANFSATARPGVGTTLGYQWWQSTNGGATWTAIDDTANPSASTPTLVLPNVAVSDSGHQYRAIATNTLDDTVLSNAATLTVSSGPSPVTPPAAPRNSTATAGDASATIAWQPPTSAGSFPVTSYQVRNDVDGNVCLLNVAQATGLECSITGLSNGRAYRFSVRALNGAGWGPWSEWSATVTPRPTPPTVTITIAGSRDGQRATALGITAGLAGDRVQAMVKVSGQISYAAGSSPPVNADGTFTWQRKTNKKVYLYFTHGDVRSNRVVIEAR